MCLLRHVVAAWMGTAAICTSGASGQYQTGFEAPEYAGSPEGVLLTGQAGWTGVEGSFDLSVWTFDGNAPGFPQHPEGGTQFAGAVVLEWPQLTRAEHEIDFSASDVWVITYDVVEDHDESVSWGTVWTLTFRPSAPGSRRYGVSGGAADVGLTTWEWTYNAYDFAGNVLERSPPGEAWAKLERNRWYRGQDVIDFGSNRILSASITDLTTGQTAEVTPEDWYLQGGAENDLPRPSTIRLFVANFAGNAGGFDNLDLRPAQVECPPDLTGDGVLDLFDFLAYVNLFNAEVPAADCVQDGSFDLFDFLCFVNAFNQGC